MLVVPPSNGPIDSEDIDFASLIETVAIHFKGQPNHAKCRKGERRWGTRGSFKINLETGGWDYWEAKAGGGVLDLIVYMGEARDRTEESAVAALHSGGVQPLLVAQDGRGAVHPAEGHPHVRPRVRGRRQALRQDRPQPGQFLREPLLAATRSRLAATCSSRPTSLSPEASRGAGRLRSTPTAPPRSSPG